MELVILHSNDTHGHLMPLPNPEGEPCGGYARRATFIAQQQATHPHLLLLDAGDYYQGSRYWHAFQGEPDIGLMNALGYDATSLGNHDFDGGLELLEQRLKQADFPVLCANMKPTDAHALADIWRPYVIQEIGDYRIAIFSLLIDIPELYPPDFSERIQCLPILETATSLVEQLRQQADMVLLLSHLGHDGDVEIAEQVSGIDLIIGGHTHTPLHEPLWINQTPIVRGLVGTQSMGRIQVQLKPRQSPILEEYRLVPLDSTFADDPAIVAELSRWQAKLPPERVLGQLTSQIDTRQEIKTLSENSAGNFYVDALLAHANPEATLAFAHMGTLRGDRIYGPGNFTNHDLSEFHPFTNPPILRKLSAPQIKQMLERGVSNLPRPVGTFLSLSGMSVTIDPSRSPQVIDLKNEQIHFAGERVVYAEYQGQSIDFTDASATFTVILESYMGMGGAGYFFLRNSHFIRQSEESGIEILEWYLKHHSPIEPKIEGRMTIIYR